MALLQNGRSWGIVKLVAAAAGSAGSRTAPSAAPASTPRRRRALLEVCIGNDPPADVALLEHFSINHDKGY